MTEKAELKNYERLSRKIKFAASVSVFCLVDKSAISDLPADLQDRRSHANLDLMKVIRLNLSTSPDEVYVYSTLTDYEAGAKALSSSEKFENQEFDCVVCPPPLLFPRLKELPISMLHLDYGAGDWTKIPSEEFPLLDELALYARLSRHDLLFHILDPDGYAFDVEIDDKNYIISYTSRAASKATIDGLKMESSRYHLVSLTPLKFVKAALKTGCDGLVFNPASENQYVFSQADLERFLYTCKVLKRKKKSEFWAQIRRFFS